MKPLVRDNRSTRLRLLFLVLGSLVFIAGAMGPIAIYIAKGKDAEFRERLRAEGLADSHIFEMQAAETERASAKLGITATLLLGVTVMSGMLAARGISRRLSQLTGYAQRIRDGDLDTRVRSEGDTEFDQLASALDRMRIDLRRVLSLSLQTTALEKDLEVASTMQHMFLPQSSSIDSGTVHLRAYYRPTARCSGDWWWHRTLDDGQTLVVIGDVTGHGTGPAMIAASAATAFHSLIDEGLETDPPRLLHELNEILGEACDGRFFMTLAAIRIDPGAMTAKLWNAGAPPSLVLQSDGAVEALMAAGSRLGESELTLGECELALTPGARLMIFTDGVPERALSAERSLGLRRLQRALSDGAEASLADAHRQVVGLLESGAADIDDDMTLLLLQVGQAPT